MPPAHVGTGDVGIEAFHTVHKAVLHQKVESAVNGDGRRYSRRTAQSGENLVRADGGMTFGDNLKNAAALRGQTQAKLGAKTIDAHHHCFHAAAVIMVFRWEGDWLSWHHRKSPYSGVDHSLMK